MKAKTIMKIPREKVCHVAGASLERTLVDGLPWGQERDRAGQVVIM
jgi:hypothetical protein